MSDRRVHTRWRNCGFLARAITRERTEGRISFSRVTPSEKGIGGIEPWESELRQQTRSTSYGGVASCIERLEERQLLSAVVPRGGVITTSFPNGPADADSVAVQADGKFVVAGTAKMQHNLYPGPGDAAVVRYNPDGSLDPTFGAGGEVLLPTGTQTDGQVYTAAIQRDGKIVVAGDQGHSQGQEDFVSAFLVRLNSDGTEDQAFDTNVAPVLASLGGSLRRGMAVQPDGKIIVTGAGPDASAPLLLARFNPDGTLDRDFGSGGIVRTSFAPGGNVSDVLFAIALQPDGRILLAGDTPNGSDYQFGILRLNADGAIDQTFANGGRATASFPGNDNLLALAVGSDGKIVASGDVQPPNGFEVDAIARFNADGSPDPTFGQGGKETFSINGNNDLSALAPQADGSIVAAGSSSGPRGFQGMTVLRLRPDGSLDPAFGTGGKTITQIGKFFSRANALAMLPDGRFVAAGDYAATPVPPDRSFSDNDQFAVGLFTADGKNDPTFGVPYDVNHDAAVDFADLVILTQHFGKPGTFADGDLNGDGSIGMGDVLLLTQNYGNTSAVPVGDAIATDSQSLRNMPAGLKRRAG